MFIPGTACEATIYFNAGEQIVYNFAAMSAKRAIFKIQYCDWPSMPGTIVSFVSRCTEPRDDGDGWD